MEARSPPLLSSVYEAQVYERRHAIQASQPTRSKTPDPLPFRRDIPNNAFHRFENHRRDFNNVSLRRLDTTMDVDGQMPQFGSPITSKAEYERLQRSASPTMTNRGLNYSPIIIPPGPKTAPHILPQRNASNNQSAFEVPSYMPRSPPTPPDSIDRYATKRKHQLMTPPPEQDINISHGTTSGEGRAHEKLSRARSASSPRTNRSPNGKSPKFGKKLRTAIRDWFRRSPVDDENYETIQDRHWAD